MKKRTCFQIMPKFKATKKPKQGKKYEDNFSKRETKENFFFFGQPRRT